MPHRRRLTAALPLLLLAAVPAAAGLGRWTTGGVFGGAVGGLSVAADAAGTVYAETRDGVFRSADAGRRWQRLALADVGDGESWRITLHPRAPRTLFALSPLSGIWRSADAGASFTGVYASPNLRLRRLWVSPLPPHTLYLSAHGSSPLRSEDGGASWEETGLAWETTDFAFHPRNADLVYAVTLDHLYRSRDGGRSWQLIVAGFFRGAHTLLLDARDPRTLYVAFEGYSGLGATGFARSRDGGVTWTVATKGLGSGLVALLPALDPATGTLYAGVMRAAGRGEVGELFRSRDGGASWKRLRFTEQVLALAVDPLRPSRVYAGLARSGVLRSGDGGATWQVSAHGLRAASATALAVDPFAPARLLAGGFARGGSLGLLESRDGGATWTGRSEELRRRTFRINGIAFDPNVCGAVYLASHGGVFASADAGATWQPASEGLEGRVVDLVAVHPAQPGLLYASAWFDEPCYEGRCRVYGFFRSDDGGASWIRFEPPRQSYGLRAVAFDPGAPETVHALVSEQLFTSLDGGATWARSENAPARLVDVESDPDAPGVLYALRPSSLGDGLFESRDGGRTWAPLGEPHPAFDAAQALAVSALQPRTFVVATTFRGVFASDDRGAGWKLLGGAPPPGSTLDVVLDPGRPRDVYALTTGPGGLFVLTRR